MCPRGNLGQGWIMDIDNDNLDKEQKRKRLKGVEEGDLMLSIFCTNSQSQECLFNKHNIVQVTGVKRKQTFVINSISQLGPNVFLKRPLLSIPVACLRCLDRWLI